MTFGKVSKRRVSHWADPSRPKPAYKKKKSYKKRDTAMVTANVSNNIMNKNMGFPQTKTVKLRYVTTIAVAGLAPQLHQFRLNSLNDPDFTGVGHQAMGHDQYAAIYNKYLVTGCRATIMASQTNTHDFPCVYTWAVRDNSSIFSVTLSHAIEEGNRSVMQMGYAGAGDSCKSMTRYANVAKYFGSKKLRTTDEDFTAVTGTNPVKELYGSVQIFAADDTVKNISTNFTIILDYYTTFFNQREIVQS